jgi:hypothetical protein
MTSPIKLNPKASDNSGASEDPSGKPKKQYVSQSDVPAYSLSKALRVPRAIADDYGKSPTRPLRVAEALNIMPASSNFRMLTGAAVAYGLTDAGYSAELISLTPLGKRIIAPTSEGDELQAKREAMLRPRVIREFLTKYNGSRIPSESIARNVLEEMGVPGDKTAATLQLIIEGAREVGFVRELKGQTYVDLHAPAPEVATSPAGETDSPSSSEKVPSADNLELPPTRAVSVAGPSQTPSIKHARVFISHASDPTVIAQLRELLAYGDFETVVWENTSDDASAVGPRSLLSRKMDAMRRCSAAVIALGSGIPMVDMTGSPLRTLSPNLLLEVGAAVALFGSRVIFLVDRGCKLPEALEGMPTVNWQGGQLDFEGVMTLVKAFNEFRKAMA